MISIEPQTAKTIIERFFDALFTQGIDAALKLVTVDTVFEAQRPSSIPIYGRFEGHEGVRKFVAILQELFDTEKFEIRRSLEQAETALAFGYMQHRVIKTDRVFSSEFAIYCQITNDCISAYKMFEDTATLAIARYPPIKRSLCGSNLLIFQQRKIKDSNFTI